MRDDVAVLKNVFARKSMVRRLKRLLLKNSERWCLTDLYLVNPVLRSKECTAEFRRFVLGFINGKSQREICELVNSAVSTLLTYRLAGGEKNSKLVRDVVRWIKAQRLSDGGWHWKPVRFLSPDIRGEAWITAGVLAALKVTGEADESYIGSIIKFLEKDWETREWGENPEVTLVYLGVAGINKDNPLVRKAIELLKINQLSNGAWPGYSAKTVKGGVFRTCVVLNGLASVGLGLEDESIVRGLKFAQSRLDEIVNARWGGVLIQAFYSLTNALVQLRLID